MYTCVLLTDLQHLCHPTPGGGEEKQVVGVGSGPHEDTGDVAPKSGGSQLLQKVIQVDIPEKATQDRTLFGSIELSGLGVAPLDPGSLLFIDPGRGWSFFLSSIRLLLLDRNSEL